MTGKIQLRYSTEVIKPLPKRGYLRFLMASPFWLIAKVPWLARKLFVVSTNERLVDYPFAHANLGVAPGAKVLDVGCCGSILPIELASLGYKVWGLDMGDYPLVHPNFTFVRGDIGKLPFEDNFFDAVTAISTIEHVGLARYGDSGDSEGDRKAVAEMRRVLRPGGRLLLAAPFGNGSVAVWKGVNLHRAYNWEALSRILEGFQVVDARFYLRSGDSWSPVSREEARNAQPLQVWHGFHLRVVADCHVVAVKAART